MRSDFGGKKMIYAIFGDLHSSLDDTRAVLGHISEIAPNAERIGLGDLFECVISKKRIAERFASVNDVILRPIGFEALLTFPSVSGNQEDRILTIVTGRDPLLDQLKELPECIELPGGKVIHGHQWIWSGEPWLPELPLEQEEILFFGHSHRSSYYIDGKWHTPEFGKVYSFVGERVGVNVGSVIENREWVLYNSEDQTVVFYKVDRE